MIVIKKACLKVDKIKEKRSLVGKIHVDRAIGKETIQTTMEKI